MKYTIQHNNSNSAYIITLSEKFEVDLYWHILIELISKEKTNESVNTIWNISDIDFSSVTETVLIDIKHQRSRFNIQQNEDSKIAIVSNKERGREIGIQYMDMTSDFSQHVRVFSENQAALDWINSKS